MNYQVSASPLVTLQTEGLRVRDLGDGASTLIRVSDEQVLSCQPTGTWELRPSGSAGAYERCTVSNGCATYNPLGPTHQGYVFSLQAVPNA